MKNNYSILLLALILFLVSCKNKMEEDVFPRETYVVLPNHFIKLYGTNPIGSRYSIEKGGNKYVALYMLEEYDLRNCNDCGAQFHAFEFEPTLAGFNYTTEQSLSNAKVIEGVTGSFGGPRSSLLRLGRIKGQKMGSDSWRIEFDLPADNLRYYPGFKKTAIFRVQ